MLAGLAFATKIFPELSMVIACGSNAAPAHPEDELLVNPEANVVSTSGSGEGLPGSFGEILNLATFDAGPPESVVSRCQVLSMPEPLVAPPIPSESVSIEEGPNAGRTTCHVPPPTPTSRSPFCHFSIGVGGGVWAWSAVAMPHRRKTELNN